MNYDKPYLENSNKIKYFNNNYLENNLSNNNKFSLKVSQPYCSSYDFNNNNWIPKSMYWINNYDKFSDISKYIVKEK